RHAALALIAGIGAVALASVLALGLRSAPARRSLRARLGSFAYACAFVLGSLALAFATLLLGEHVRLRWRLQRIEQALAPVRAPLVVEFDADERVCGMDVERPARGTLVSLFDPDAWRGEHARRAAMAWDLAQSDALERLARTTVIARLGPPDGTCVLRDATWE